MGQTTPRWRISPPLRPGRRPPRDVQLPRWLRRRRDDTVKRDKIVPATDGEPVLLLLEATGRCPPEDCGGPSGYERAPEILAETGRAKPDSSPFAELRAQTTRTY
nr:hypothetical protein [Roseiarcus fermentans]